MCWLILLPVSQNTSNFWEHVSSGFICGVGVGHKVLKGLLRLETVCACEVLLHEVVARCGLSLWSS
jgi:hypothetical protein